jgi:hypothetical protein
MENNKMKGIVSELKEMPNDDVGTPIGESDGLVIERETNGKLSFWKDPRSLDKDKFKRFAR